MDSKTYVQNAIRTESRIAHAVVEDRFTFQTTVEAFIAVAKLLDMYKKNIYYGKPIDSSKWITAVNELVDATRQLSQGHYLPLSKTDVLHVDSRVLHAVIGIATESGELMEALYKKLALYEDVDNVNLAEEVGDLNWYEAILIDALDADWDQIRERNIAKLKARYPEKFDSDKAMNRNLDKERDILEGKLPPSLDPNSPEYVPGDARAVADAQSTGGSDF